MCDFDLSQALEGPVELDERGFEPSCFNMKPHHVQDFHDGIFRLDEGLDLMVSHDPVTLQCVATLLVAVTKMKKSLPHGGRQLSNDELCGAIMDNLVEETIVKTTVDYSTDEKKGKFIRLNSREVGTLCDDENKDVIQDSGELKLQAVTLKGGHCGRKVRFKLSRYVNSCVSPGDGETVRLSITNTNLHISCSMKDGRPALNLEECSREKLQEISGDENRFLFFKRFNGTISIVTLESVKCPGWFISTCHEVENQPVEMCEPDTIRRIMRFKLN